MQKGTHISEGELYTLAELQERLAVGLTTIRQWRREGLLVIRAGGNRPFFSGRHVIAFMEARASDEVASAGGLPQEA